MSASIYPEGSVVLRIENPDTGRVEIRILEPDEYAVLYGPQWQLVEERRVPLVGDVILRLRRVR